MTLGKGARFIINLGKLPQSIMFLVSHILFRFHREKNILNASQWLKLLFEIIIVLDWLFQSFHNVCMCVSIISKGKNMHIYTHI